MTGLKGEFMRFVPSQDGIQAELFLIEPTGEELQVRCLCRDNNRTDIGVIGDFGHYQRLVQTYGEGVVVEIAKNVTLSR